MNSDEDLGLSLNPLAPACLEGGRVISRQQFLQWTDAFKLGLRAVGIQSGHLVAVCVNSTAQNLALHHSLQAASVVTMALPLRWPVASQQAWLQLKQPQLVVVDTARQAQTLAQSGVKVVTVDELRQGAQAAPVLAVRVRHAVVNTCRLDLRAMQAAQGLTARISRVQWQQWMADMSAQATAQSRMLLGPLHQSMSVAMALGVLRAGGLVVFEPLRTTAAWLASVQRHAISHVLLDATWLPGLLAEVPELGVALPAMQQLRLMGKALPPEVLAQARERLTPEIVDATQSLALIPSARPKLKEAHTHGANQEMQGFAIRKDARNPAGVTVPCQADEWLQGVNNKKWLH
jgi:non-ribosomal peptide synthetase component E (peptide arylation enzyme)